MSEEPAVALQVDSDDGADIESTDPSDEAQIMAEIAKEFDFLPQDTQLLGLSAKVIWCGESSIKLRLTPAPVG